MRSPAVELSEAPAVDRHSCQESRRTDSIAESLIFLRRAVILRKDFVLSQTSFQHTRDGQRTLKTSIPRLENRHQFRMHLMYTLDGNGKRQYTLKKITDGEVTKSAHPARFSPDDKYSRYVKPRCTKLVDPSREVLD